jgi:hypothetical protein
MLNLTLFLVAPLLLGAVAGEMNEKEVPGMITISAERPRERRLATATVWCVSIANVSDATLQSSLDWACGPLANQGQVNCGPINVGGVCYEPNTLAHHCDWAFNAYFQKMNATDDACSFSGTAQKVYTDPSSGTCIFQGSNITTNSTTGTPGAEPSGSPGSPAGSPIYSPNGAMASLQPHYLFRWSTAIILVTMLFT